MRLFCNSQSYGNLHIGLILTPNNSSKWDGWYWESCNSCPSTICIQWGREMHGVCTSLTTTQCREQFWYSSISLLHTIYMYFGPEMYSHPNHSQHQCCVQFQHLDDSLHVWKHMVFGQDLYKHPNLAQHQYCLLEANTRGQVECTGKIIL